MDKALDNQQIQLFTYEEILEQLETTRSNNHLLLGNGFNMSLGIKTRYSDIFEEMKQKITNH